MIKYSLKCEFLHTFEAWFSNSASFEQQCNLDLVQCPECGSSKIKRALMTPNLNVGKHNKKQNHKLEVDNTDRVASESGIGIDKGSPKISQVTKRPDFSPDRKINPDQAITILRNIRSFFEKNGRNVGDKFAQEAIKIHYGESEPDLIYGTCTPEEGEQLMDEGVEFAELPALPKDN